MEKKFAYNEIGNIIRKHRKGKKLRLTSLAETSGVSIAMLSKIENGRMLPTIPTLFAVIGALGIAPDTFFSELGRHNTFPGYVFIPKTEYASFVKEENAKGFHYFSILEHHIEGTSLQISLLHLDPGAKRKVVTTHAYEYIYLISGTIEYALGDQTFHMREGDSLFFDGNIPHVPLNKSDKIATLLVFYLFNEA
ncbi:helix-turn-helix domain-containing protein [Sphingobacterium sp. SGG-5]|uniref:helix-turn-helix domain-containing protein n=1 Tax=Sphingobacterium sp. SGG-5 TaxID=2710881 RepID=UPI0019D04477|nr:XRE family transcriptional regulator [Sphingobacterium sp. SGG-5]